MTINIIWKEDRYVCVKLKRRVIESDAQDTPLKGLSLNFVLLVILDTRPDFL